MAATGNNKWKCYTFEGQIPKPRYKHGAAVVKEKMFVIGGFGAGYYLKDIHVFDFNRLSWSKLESNIEQGTYGHSLISYGDKIFSLAGQTEGQTKSFSVKQFDTQTCTWSTVPTDGRSPTSRIGQSVTRVADTLVVFGGEDDGRSLLNDIHILDLHTMTWKNFQCTGAPPSPRSEHTAACYDDRLLFIFGGRCHSNFYSDLHVLDMNTMVWSIPGQCGVTPNARAGHAGATSGHNWFITGGGDGKEAVMETLVLDMSNLTWSVLPSLEGSEPPTSEGSSLVCHNMGGDDYLFSFGGYNKVYRNEVYVLKTSCRSSMSSNSMTSLSAQASTSRERIYGIKELQDERKFGAFFCSQCRLLMSNDAEILDHLKRTKHNCFVASVSIDHELTCMGCRAHISSMIELQKHTCDGGTIYFVKELPSFEEGEGCMTPFDQPAKLAQMDIAKKLMSNKYKFSPIPFRLSDNDEISVHDENDEHDEHDEHGEAEDSEEDDEGADLSHDPLMNTQLNFLEYEIPESESDSEDSAYNDETSSFQLHYNSRTLKNLVIEATDRKMLRDKYIIAEAVPPQIAMKKVEKAIKKYEKQHYLSRPQRMISYEPILGQVCLQKIPDTPNQPPSRHRYSVAKALRMVRILRIVFDLLKHQKPALRENALHYIYPTKFQEDNLKPEHLGRRIADAVLEITLLLKISRESLRLRPSPKGLIKGDVRLYIDENSEEKLLCDCTLGGESCTVIPSEADLIIRIDIPKDIKYVLVIEKDTIFHYLAALGFAESESCILICGKGQPDIATRVLLRKLRMQLPEIPFYAIVDCNPSGAQIFLTYCFGSENRSHDNLFLTVTDLKYIGLTVNDVDPGMLKPLSDEDVKKVDKILGKSYLPINESVRTNLIQMKFKGGANLDLLMSDNKLVELIKEKTQK